MKRIIKSTFFCFLLFSIGLIMLTGITTTVLASETGSSLYMLKDDFSDDRYINGVTCKWSELNNDAWTRDAGTGEYVGCYTGYCSAATVTAGDNVTGANYCLGLTDYTVETDFTLVRSGSVTTPRFSIMGRLTPNASSYTRSNCYDLYASQDYIQLRKFMGTGAPSDYLVRDTFPTAQKLKLGDKHNLKMEFRGSIIKGYLDGKLLITYDAANPVNGDAARGKGEPYIAGTASLAIWGNDSETRFDNFKMTPVENGEYTKVPAFADDFSDDRYINGVTYKWNELNNDAWTMDAGTGEYVGCYTGYSSAATVTAGDNVTGANYCLGLADYTVETDFTLVRSGSVTTPRFSIMGRLTPNASSYMRSTCYDLYASQDYIQLRKFMGTGAPSDYLVRYTFPTAQKLKLGDKHNLKMEFRGSIIKGYLDGKLLITYDAADPVNGDAARGKGEPYVAGTASLAIWGNDSETRFDNFGMTPPVVSGTAFTDDFSSGGIGDRLTEWEFNTSDGSCCVWSIENEKLKLTNSGPVGNGNYGSAYLKGREEMDNYFVQSDVIIDESGNGNASLIGRHTGINGNEVYYKFGVDAADGFYLSRVVGGSASLMASCSMDQAYMEGVLFSRGIACTLKLQMYEGEIACFANGIQVFSVSDAEKITNGTAGLSAAGGTVYFDNFETGIITDPVPGSIEIQNSAALNNVVPLGKVPDIKSMNLILHFLNADDKTIPLDTADVGSFDGTTAGPKSAAVEYGGKTTTLDYMVMERPDYIAQLNGDIASINVASLTAADKGSIYAISCRYDDLSYLEKPGITEANKEKLAAALEAIEFALCPELSGTQIVFKDEFDTTASGISWDSSASAAARSNSGYWRVENGAYVQYSPDDSCKGPLFTAASILKDKNWAIRSVSADVRVIDPNIFLGIDVCFNHGEYYEFRITDKTNVGGGNRIQLYKNNGTLLAQIVETDSSKWFKPGVWYNLKMTLDNGFIKCYIDDVQVIEYQDEPAVLNQTVYTSGTAGVMCSEGWGMVDNFVVRGTDLGGINPVAWDPGVVEPEYTDNFDDETAGESPSHWIEKNTEDKWKVQSDGGNLVYGNTDAASGMSYTWLHVFEQDVEYSAKLKAVEKGAFPQVGLTARFNADGSYINAGYDFTLQKWFIKVRLGIDFDESVTYASQTSAFNLDEWYNVKLVANKTAVSLYVGDIDAPLVTADAGSKVMPGRVGMFVYNCKACIDDVDLKLLSGEGRVEDGVLEYTPGTKSNHNSIVELPDGRLLMCTYGDHYVSSDNGQTFTPTNEFPDLYSTTIIRLHNGYYLHVLNCKDAYLSTDGCKTWAKAGTLPLDAGFSYAQPQDRINEVLLDDGTYRVFHTCGKQIKADGRGTISETFYTDDCGFTWHKSETSPLYFSGLQYFCETQVIKVKDGPLIQYCSYNNRGCLRYTLSYDNGATWEGEFAIPEITCPLGSFCVKEDPYEPGTYYMSTVYNTPYSPGNGRPRHRIALLRSYDGLHWEYLADIDRWGDVSDGGRAEIMQNVNMSLTVTEDYIFPLFTRSEQYSNDSSGHNIQLQRVYRFEKSKLQAYDRWPTEYYIDPKTIVTIEAEPAHTKYLRNSTFTTGGSRIKVHYYDGTSEDVDMSNAICSTPDMTSLGVKNVTVDYKYFRANFKIQVLESLDMVFSLGSVSLTGSSKIAGNTGTNSITADSVRLDGSSGIEGNLFVGPGADWMEVVQSTNPDPQSNVAGEISDLPFAREYPMPEFPVFPDLPDKGDFAAGQSPAGPHIINENGAYDNINVQGALTINIGDEDILIAVRNLKVSGSGSINVNRTGAGRLILYVEDQLQITGSCSVNDNGNYNDVILYYAGNDPLDIGGNTSFAGSIYAKDSNVTISGSGEITGNIVAGGSTVNITGNAAANVRVIYAPNADLTLTGSGSIKGTAVVRSIQLSGNARITYDDSINLELFEQLDWNSD